MKLIDCKVDLFSLTPSCLRPSQMWSQWDEDSAWSDSLLRGVETSFPKMHEGGDSEEQTSESLSVYQVFFINTI